MQLDSQKSPARLLPRYLLLLQKSPSNVGSVVIELFLTPESTQVRAFSTLTCIS
jgi:hypothetical protein